MIGSNFLKINGWAVVVKYATSVVYVGTHFFPQFLESSRSHSNEYNNVISSEKHAPKKMGKGLMILRNICLVLLMTIKCECSAQCRRKEGESEN